MRHLIGIAGYKQSGKGTTADLISECYSGTVKHAAFSDKLKILAARSLGYVGSDAKMIALMDAMKLDTDITIPVPSGPFAGVTHTCTVRAYLQNLGSEARKLFGEDFWVDQVLGEQRYPGVDCLVLTDMRYPNEARRIRALGGVIWRVYRPGCAPDGHDSERPLPVSLVDTVIMNNGDLGNLKREVELALELTCG